MADDPTAVEGAGETVGEARWAATRELERRYPGLDKETIEFQVLSEGERGLMGKVLSHGLTDLGRKFAPDDANLFTWWAPWRQYRERNIGWRLDLVLSSPALTERATKCTALREFGTSDHGPVTAVFEGPLFDAKKVVGGDEPAKKTETPKAPQLDLFG